MKLNNIEVDKEEDEDMPGTARDLGLRFRWLKWDPKPDWSEECSSWYISPRCFLSSCSSLVACFGTNEDIKNDRCSNCLWMFIHIYIMDI